MEKQAVEGKGETTGGTNSEQQQTRENNNLEQQQQQQQQQLQQNNNNNNNALYLQQQQLVALPQLQQQNLDVQQQQYQQIDGVGMKRGFQEEGVLEINSQQVMLEQNYVRPMFSAPFKKTKMPVFADLTVQGVRGAGLGVVAPDQSLFVTPRNSLASLQLPQIPQLIEQRKPSPGVTSLPSFFPGQTTTLQPQLLQREFRNSGGLGLNMGMGIGVGGGITPQLISQFQREQQILQKEADVSSANNKNMELSIAPEVVVQRRETSELGDIDAGIGVGVGGDTVVVESVGDRENLGEKRTICQVQDCNRSLKGLKDFHLRYRICDIHIKLPQVMKEGKLQRFCQQCARFHELSAFDGQRRSCRVQLERHNARRRKKKETDSASEDKQPGPPQLQTPSASPQFTLTTQHLKRENSDQGLCYDMDKIIRAFMEKPEYLVALRQLMWPKLNSNPNNRCQEIRIPNGQDATGVTSSVTYNHALELLNHSNLVSYSSNNRNMRVCQKLFEVHPEDLPSDISDLLLGWLAEAPVAVDTIIRPGCTFITLQFILKQEQYQSILSKGVQPIIDHLLNTNQLHSKLFCSGRWSIQLEEHMGTVKNGVIEKLWNLADPKSGGPSLQQVEPMVITQNSNKICIQGCNILDSDSDSKLICRDSRGYFQIPISESLEKSSDWIQSFEFEINNLDSLDQCVLLLVEVQKGDILSNFAPVILIQNDYEISEELQHLLGSIRNQIQDYEIDTLVIEIGTLIEIYFKLTSKNNSQLVLGEKDSTHQNSKFYKFENSCDSKFHLFDKDFDFLCKKIQRLELDGTLEFVCAQVCQLGLRNLIEIFLSMRLKFRNWCNFNLKDFVLIDNNVVRSYCKGLSLMHLAVCSEEMEATQYLLQFCYKYDIQTQIGMGDEQGVTPLHLATMVADADQMTTLLLINYKLGSLSQTMGFDGITPLQIAYLERNCTLRCVLKLLQKFLCFVEKGVDLEELYDCKGCKAEQSQMLVSFQVLCGNCLGFKGALVDSVKKCKICSTYDSCRLVFSSLCTVCMRGFEQSLGEFVSKHNPLFS